MKQKTITDSDDIIAVKHLLNPSNIFRDRNALTVKNIPYEHMEHVAAYLYGEGAIFEIVEPVSKNDFSTLHFTGKNAQAAAKIIESLERQTTASGQNIPEQSRKISKTLWAMMTAAGFAFSSPSATDNKPMPEQSPQKKLQETPKIQEKETEEKPKPRPRNENSGRVMYASTSVQENNQTLDI